VLPLRGDFLYPGHVSPFPRERTPARLVDALLEAPAVAAFVQRGPGVEDARKEDFHAVGCAARVVRTRELGVVLHGVARVRLETLEREPTRLLARVTELPDEGEGDDVAMALMAVLRDVHTEPWPPNRSGCRPDLLQESNRMLSMKPRHRGDLVQARAGRGHRAIARRRAPPSLLASSLIPRRNEYFATTTSP
jgi:ATP-dependent Lon protease